MITVFINTKCGWSKMSYKILNREREREFQACTSHTTVDPELPLPPSWPCSKTSMCAPLLLMSPCSPSQSPSCVLSSSTPRCDLIVPHMSLGILCTWLCIPLLSAPQLELCPWASSRTVSVFYMVSVLPSHSPYPTSSWWVQRHLLCMVLLQSLWVYPHLPLSMIANSCTSHKSSWVAIPF